MIISASRRTDIPAFFPEWLMQCVRDGFVVIRNPFNNVLTTVDLTPEAVTALVFWTRNPLPLIPFLPELGEMGYKYYFLMTVTLMGHPLERNNPSPEKAIEGFLQASEFAPVHWRFDPILYDGSRESADEVLQRFSRIASAFKGRTDRCYISFMQPYRKQERRFREIGYHYVEASDEAKRELAFEIGRRGRDCGIGVYACCSPYLESETVKPGSCINRETLEAITGKPIDAKAHPSRKDCNCIRSVDIGSYDTCLHDCLYCYATRKPGRR